MNDHSERERDLVTSDIELLDQLSDALDVVEPIPPHLREAAYSAHLMSNIEAELAELIYDSLEARAPMLRRGAENQSRLLSFSNDYLTLDASFAADGSTIVGEVHPVVAGEVHLESRGREPVVVMIDEFGRFRAASDAQTVRLRVPGHLVTPWIERR